MRMVVSKKTLSLVRSVPIKGEASGQGAPHSSPAFYCVFSPAITPYFKLPLPSNSNLDLISSEASTMVAGSRMARQIQVAVDGPLNRVSTLRFVKVGRPALDACET